MKTRTFWFWAIGVAVTDAIFTAWSYGQMPERIPIHWSAAGKVDAWGSKETYLLIGPGGMILAMLLALAIPYLSPPRFKIEPFRDTFYKIILFMIILLGFIHAFTAMTALNPEKEMGNWLIVGICVFLSLMGNLLGRLKPNFYAGIRTPWTLSNEEVWRRTHRLGGKLFFFGGILGAILAALNLLIPAMVVIAIAGSVPVVYSFVLSKHLEASS